MRFLGVGPRARATRPYEHGHPRSDAATSRSATSPREADMAARTRTATLYHLLNVTPTEDGLLDALDDEQLDLNRFRLVVPHMPGATAVAIIGQYYRSI